MILTKRDQHVNEMMAVAVKKIKIFDDQVFLQSDKTLNGHQCDFAL